MGQGYVEEVFEVQDHPTDSVAGELLSIVMLEAWKSPILWWKMVRGGKVASQSRRIVEDARCFPREAARNTYGAPNMHTFSLLHLVATTVCLLSAVCATTTPTRAADATLRVRAGQRSPYPVPQLMTGKFTEHLYNNIYHGIDAQVLWNPTVSAHYPFSTGQQTPDGVATFHWDREKIGEAIRRQSPRIGWPEAALPALIDAYNDGLACWWTRVGPREEVLVSPDTAPFGQHHAPAGTAEGRWRHRTVDLPAAASRPHVGIRRLSAQPDLAQCTVACTGTIWSSPWPAPPWRCRKSGAKLGANWSCLRMHPGRPVSLLNHRRYAGPTGDRARLSLSRGPCGRG